jgi:hypothetical protein
LVKARAAEEKSVLDFDLENRPLSYLGQDWTSAEITAIAWSWNGEDLVKYLLLTSDGYYKDRHGVKQTPVEAFARFRDILASAGIVTGHYIRKHDLPVLNSAMMENKLPPLPSLLTSDTHGDLVRRKDLSASQENLASLLRLPEPKHHMTQTEWREANRLFTNKKLALTRQRVVSDVVQHKALRAELVRLGLLKAPRMWRS